MLTYSSDSLPQIVCPMDEDAIPPNPFCSAPPHNEPPPPLLPLSSITPSCVNDGISGNRRRGRIQGIKTPKTQSDADSSAAQKPSRQTPSPNKRQRESGNMVQASKSKQLKVESTHAHEKQDEFDFSAAEECQNKQTDQKSPRNKPNVFAAENVVEQFADNTTRSLDATKSDMDTCQGLAVGHTVENTSAPKGWVIGPLFQSFKSKMASFTEIVLTPVKLFRANSPPPSMDHQHKRGEFGLQTDGTSAVESSEPSNTFLPERQSENGNQDDKANQESSLSQVRLCDGGGEQNGKTVALKHSRKLAFDDECAITQNEKNSVPLQHSPLPCIVSEQVSEPIGSVIRSSILLQPSVNVSASHESKISSVVEEQKGKLSARVKPLPRKRTGNRSDLKKVTSKTLTSEIRKEDPEASDEQLSHINSVTSNKADSSDTDKTLSLVSSVCYAQSDTDWLHHDGVDDARKIETGRLVRQSLQRKFNNDANEATLNPTLDTQHLKCQLNSEAYSAASLGRAKRSVKLDCHSQDLVKRKRLTADKRTEDTKNQELLNVASDSGILKGLRPLRREIGLTDTILDEEETLKPARKRQAVSTRSNRRGKGGKELLAVLNEQVLHMQTECAADAESVCTLDKSRENNQKDGSSSKAKPSGSCKRLRTRTGLGKPDVDTDDRMDVETTVGITSTKQAQQEPLSEVFVHLSDIDPLQRLSKCRNINKKPRKRQSLNQAATKSDSTLVSTSSELSMEQLEHTPPDLNTSQRVESWKTGLNQPTKRPKKDCRSSVKFSVSCGTEETKQCNDNLHVLTKESQPKEGKGKISTDPVYFEMTPFESNHQPVSSPSRSDLNCSVKINSVFKDDMDEKDTSTCPASPEAGNHSSINVSRLRSSARRVNIKPRRADNQRRKCRVLHSRKRTGEEVTNSITMEDTDLATSGTRSSENNSFSRRLLRSYSCPEIPSFCPHDVPWTSSLHSPQHSRIHTPHQHQSSTHTPFVPHAHKSLQRARRHTVCSVEVEREIAPLCLRKEVYPARRSAPYDGVTQHLSPSLAFSPSTSFSAFASCFLSSPLAFLSKKIDGRGAASSPGTPAHVSSPATSSSTSPLSSSTWHHAGFFQRTDSSGATLDSSSSRNPLECKIERRQQSEEEDDGEDTSSSSQEFEDVGLREEKALSDSEIKVVQKHEERGKVSSIRIRKTLPKPQNNLTPMGLPKPIRLKKKEFSLEEIYTNKNFSKPPESRLETIFEVPLSRRNGSESWFGQRRVKRFLEFVEVGEARKPKKPLVGVGKSGISSSRTRRGGFPKDEPSLIVQDVDSLLCAKLDQLNLWLMHDQKHS